MKKYIQPSTMVLDTVIETSIMDLSNLSIQLDDEGYRKPADPDVEVLTKERNTAWDEM